MRKLTAMVVAGVMSGTSADGVDVALARVSPAPDPGGTPKVKVLGHSEFRYPEAVREAVLKAASGEMKTAELSRLNWRLGGVYAECVARACASAGLTAGLVGMHGQTVYHQATAEQYAGESVRATWQIGEAAVVAERLRVPVVSDFRPADLAGGGQGAPLVPMLDYCLFRSKTRNRVLLNLGGIANMTAVPAGAGLDEVIAFDTGPGNMVVDGLMFKLYGRLFDCGGGTAGRGNVLIEVVEELLKDEYFSAPPPKSCGREQFGSEFAERLVALCAAAGGNKPDVLATATEITAASVIEAYERFVRTKLTKRATEVIAAGGGTQNSQMMRRLRDGFGALGVKVLLTDDVGIASQAKEAVAFALLAWLSWHGLPGNVPAATGAARAVVLGKVTC